MRSSYLFRITGIALFIYFLHKVNIRSVFATIGNTDILLLIIAVMISYASVFIRAQRFRLTVKNFYPEYDISLLRCYMIYYAGLFSGSLTPSRTGELVKIRYIDSVKKTQGIYIVIMDRLFDIFGIALCGLAALYYINYRFVFDNRQVLILFSLLIVLFFLFFFFIFPYFRKRIDIDILRKYLFADNLFQIISLTLCGFAVYFLWYFVLSRAGGIDIPYITLFFIQSIVIVVNLLPVTIMGMGTREAVYLYFMKDYGYNKSSILGFGMLILFFYILNIITGFICFQILEHNRKRELEEL
ncbi:MAG: lysylphosphatidylglycerol synthase transmembrane domain-containing protein [Candidatus Muiribacteriaceae bacterium]